MLRKASESVTSLGQRTKLRSARQTTAYKYRLSDIEATAIYLDSRSGPSAGGQSLSASAKRERVGRLIPEVLARIDQDHDFSDGSSQRQSFRQSSQERFPSEDGIERGIEFDRSQRLSVIIHA